MELTDDRLNEIIKCVTYHQRVPQYGNRAWMAEGLHLDVVYWDVGNGWCQILHVIPERGFEGDVERFFRKVREDDGGESR